MVQEYLYHRYPVRSRILLVDFLYSLQLRALHKKLHIVDINGLNSLSCMNSEKNIALCFFVFNVTSKQFRCLEENKVRK